jgi:hypothetical protein
MLRPPVQFKVCIGSSEAELARSHERGAAACLPAQDSWLKWQYPPPRNAEGAAQCTLAVSPFEDALAIEPASVHTLGTWMPRCRITERTELSLRLLAAAVAGISMYAAAPWLAICRGRGALGLGLRLAGSALAHGFGHCWQLALASGLLLDAGFAACDCRVKVSAAAAQASPGPFSRCAEAPIVLSRRSTRLSAAARARCSCRMTFALLARMTACLRVCRVRSSNCTSVGKQWPALREYASLSG